MSARARIHAMFSLDAAAGAELDTRLNALVAETVREDAELAQQRTGGRGDQRVLLDFAMQFGRRAHAIDSGAILLDRAADRPTPETPDFFQPGHTYADGSIWRFRCDTVTTHPDDGELCALGWVLFNGQWQEASYYADDWEMGKAIGWTDVTEAGEAS